MQNPESIKIVERFFEALYDLKRRKAIRGKNTFVRRYGINKGNFWQIENDKSRDMFQHVWLSYLVTDYGVSAEWLLTGIGDMYTREPDSVFKFKNKAYAGKPIH